MPRRQQHRHARLTSADAVVGIAKEMGVGRIEAAQPLFGRSPGSCTGCHGNSATSGFMVLTYEAIRSGGQVSGTEIIVAGKPCESLLFLKLGPAPPYGARMPYSGPPYYSADDLALLRDWIAEGAHDN